MCAGGEKERQLRGVCGEEEAGYVVVNSVSVLYSLNK